MGRKSSVMRQPPEIREEINERMDNGQTLDEVIAWLRENGVAGVSRTALWRHAKNIDRIMAKVRQSRMLAEVVTRRLKDAPEGRHVMVNVQLLHGVLTKLIDAAANEEKVTIGAKEAQMLGRTIESLAKAEKLYADKTIRVEEYQENVKPAAEGAGKGLEVHFIDPEGA